MFTYIHAHTQQLTKFVNCIAGVAFTAYGEDERIRDSAEHAEYVLWRALVLICSLSEVYVHVVLHVRNYPCSHKCTEATFFPVRCTYVHEYMYVPIRMILTLFVVQSMCTMNVHVNVWFTTTGHTLGTSLFSPPPSSTSPHGIFVNSPTTSGKVAFSPVFPTVGSGSLLDEQPVYVTQGEQIK